MNEGKTIRASNFDHYMPWINYIKPTNDGRWETSVFPNGIFKADGMDSIAIMVGKYIMNEVIILISDYLCVRYEDVMHHKRISQDVSDAKMICAYIIYNRFPFSQNIACMALNYANHTSYHHARKQVNMVVEINVKKDKILKAYPFLLNDNLSVRL